MARGVVLVPFLLRHLGLEAYGIWTTIFILVSYVGVSTLGISNVYIKYVAEFHARREYDKANALLSTGLAITIPLCGAIFLGFWLGWNWYSPWLHLPPAHAADGKEAVLIVLGVFLSAIAFNGFGDILTATQQIASTQWFLIMGIVAELGRDCVAGGRRARHSRAGRGVSGARSVQRRTLHLVGLEKAQVAAPFAAHGAPRFHPLRAAFRRAGAVPKHVVDFSRLGGAGGGTGPDRRRSRRTAGRRQKMAHCALQRSHGVFLARFCRLPRMWMRLQAVPTASAEPARALSEQLALRKPVHVGFCGRHRAVGRAHNARLAGPAVAGAPGADRPVCGIQFGHAIPYAYRTGDFDVSRHGPRVRGVHLFDSQHRSAGQSRCRRRTGSKAAGRRSESAWQWPWQPPARPAC